MFYTPAWIPVSLDTSKLHPMINTPMQCFLFRRDAPITGKSITMIKKEYSTQKER